MANRLEMAITQAIVQLKVFHWSNRRIAEHLGIDCATVTRHPQQHAQAPNAAILPAVSDLAIRARTATTGSVPDATVTICHSRTLDLAAVTRGADILVAAIGRLEFVKADMVRPGAVVVDVGTSRFGDRIVGAVDFAGVSAVASAISPVPGSVGPMTITTLLANTVKAAKLGGL